MFQWGCRSGWYPDQLAVVNVELIMLKKQLLLMPSLNDRLIGKDKSAMWTLVIILAGRDRASCGRAAGRPRPIPWNARCRLETCRCKYPMPSGPALAALSKASLVPWISGYGHDMCGVILAPLSRTPRRCRVSSKTSVSP